jgi:hypothetical protein
MSACAVLQPYSPSAFRELLDFDVVRPKVPQIEAASQEISSIFLKHQMEGFAGMAMMHKHFELSDTEMLVEETRGCHSVIRPVTLGTDRTNLLPYMFKLKCEDHGFVLVPTEFAPAELVSRANFDNLMSKGEFVNELGHYVAGLQVTAIVRESRVHSGTFARVSHVACRLSTSSDSVSCIALMSRKWMEAPANLLTTTSGSLSWFHQLRQLTE